MEKPIIFISHSSKDGHMASMLQEIISEAFQGSFGFFNSSDYQAISPGDQWRDAIIRALKKCELVLVVVTKNSIKNRWVSFEVGGGLVNSGKVIPCFGMDTRISDFPSYLDHVQSVDITSSNGVRQLLEKLESYCQANLPHKFSFDRAAAKMVSVWKSFETDRLEFDLTATVVKYPEQIYSDAINLLNSYRWSKIRVFAPIGLWEDNPHKSRWLAQLTKALMEDRIESLEAIFGFPDKGMKLPYDPEITKIEEEQDAEIGRKLLTIAGSYLSLFEETPRTKLRFIPPVEVSIGSGAILFESKNDDVQNTFLALSQGQDHWITELGIDFNDPGALHDFYSNWFDRALMVYSTVRFVLKDSLARPPVTLSSSWDKIVRRYYHKKAWVSWKKLSGKKTI